MDSYILPFSSLSSSQVTIPTAEPLSAAFLQYQLSRTPTPKRFSRNANQTPLQRQNPKRLHNGDGLSLTKTVLGPASEFIAQDAAANALCQAPRATKRWPVPKQVTATRSTGTNRSTQLSHGHGDAEHSTALKNAEELTVTDEDEGENEDDMTLNDAIQEAALIKQAHKANKNIEPRVSSSTVQRESPLLPRSHISNDHPAASPRGKTPLKRPKKRHPLPCAPPVHQKQASTDIQHDRQFSIPDDERPVKIKKQKRPRASIAPRNLPLDELELAEERFIIPYDAPPLSDSDDADSDPLEEPSDDRVQRQRQPEQSNIGRNTRAVKEKHLPVRSARKTPLTLSGFKVIKPLLAPARAIKTKTQEHLAVGDGFEGPERLPIGNTPRSAKPRRRVRQQVRRPSMYYRALEIVEFKPLDTTLGDRHSSAPAEYSAQGPDPIHGDILPVASVQSSSEALVMEVDIGLAAATVLQDLSEVEELGPVDIDKDGHPLYGDKQVLKAHEAEMSLVNTPSYAQGRLLDAAEVDENSAAILEEADIDTEVDDVSIAGHKTSQGRLLDAAEVDENSAAILEEADIDTEVDDVSIAGHKTSQDKSPREGTDAHLLTAAEDCQQLEHDLSQNHPILPKPRFDKKEAPSTNKLKRRVTFSDEVKIQTDVDPESEAEYEFESETQSEAEFDGVSEQSRSTDSDLESEEGDELNGFDDDADNEGHEDEDDFHATANLDDRAGSPELVSSGYYARSSGLAKPHFGFRSDMMVSRHFIKENNEDDSGSMMLDIADEEEKLPQPLHARPHHRFNNTEEIADSDDEVLIMISRATPAEWELPLGSDGVGDTDDGEGDVSDNNLDTYSRLPRTAHEPDDSPIIPDSNHNSGAAPQLFFGLGRSFKGLRRNLADSAIAMTPPTTHTSFDISEQSQQSHGDQNGPKCQPLPSKYKRSKTGTGLQQHSDTPAKRVSVRDVPSYFTRASRTFSSPLKNVKVMMRRARTLPSTQYVSESGDENGFIISDESFRERLKSRKRHLSFSDSIDDRDNVDLKELLKRSNVEMGRGGGVKRNRSLAFKSPLKEHGAGI